MMAPLPASIDETLTFLTGAGYVADRPLATVLFLALKLGRPLFLEGEAGVGKTEIAKVLSAALGRASFACSATRASTSPRRCMSGTTSGR
jgi:MoxR-like ATPase